jgi:hypothetical protein
MSQLSFFKHSKRLSMLGFGRAPIRSLVENVKSTGTPFLGQLPLATSCPQLGELFSHLSLKVAMPSLEWTELGWPWVGTELPCNEGHMDFLFAMTKVAIGDERKAMFLNAPWADVISPKTIAPSIFPAQIRNLGRFGSP